MLSLMRCRDYHQVAGYPSKGQHFRCPNRLFWFLNHPSRTALCFLLITRQHGYRSEDQANELIGIPEGPVIGLAQFFG